MLEKLISSPSLDVMTPVAGQFAMLDVPYLPKICNALLSKINTDGKLYVLGNVVLWVLSVTRWCMLAWLTKCTMCPSALSHPFYQDKEENMAFHATLQTMTRLTHNYTRTDLVQDGPGEFTKTNWGDIWVACWCWWGNQEEMKSARVPACLFQSWQNRGLTRWFLIYKLFYNTF